MMHRFDAQYESDCQVCGDRIWEDDSIGYIDDVIACSNCCDNEEDNECAITRILKGEAK